MRNSIVALTVCATALFVTCGAAQGPQPVQPPQSQESAKPAQAAQPQQKTEPSQAWLNTPTKVKDIAQTVAWAAAALFFGYKVYAGYMFINMSIAVETRRRTSRRRSGRDDLVVRTILTKGDRATLPLGVVEIVVDSANPPRVEVNEIQVSEKGGVRPINLTPGEATHFESCFDVDSDSLATIVVTVRGSRRGCWRASYVSLPNERLQT